MSGSLKAESRRSPANSHAQSGGSVAGPGVQIGPGLSTLLCAPCLCVSTRPKCLGTPRLSPREMDTARLSGPVGRHDGLGFAPSALRMQDDRSGLVLPVVLAAWVLGVGWALVGLGEDEGVSNATVARGNASPAASPVIEIVEEYDPPRTVTFIEDGEYVGLRFNTAGNVIDEQLGEAAAGSTAPTSKQITVHGEPYFLLVDGTWVEWYMAGEHLEFPSDD